jgi:GNAT superfamily N-acetyltransferase
MVFREANEGDIPGIQLVRNSVKENRLSNPLLVKDEDCLAFISKRGKGWVCEVDSRIAGFAIAELQEHNVWALFIHPEWENLGIGKKLHKQMLDWYFSKTSQTIWLGTAPGTRAEEFYRRQGWRETGMHGNEIKFEMSSGEWLSIQ